MQYIEVSIRKPIYSNFVYIRDKYLRQAKLNNVPLKITIPQGTSYMTYDEFMKDAKFMSKVFKDPEHPMELYGNWVDLSKKTPPQEKDFFDVYELVEEGAEEAPTEEKTITYTQEVLF